MYLEEGEIQKGRANTLQTSFHQKVIKNYPDFNFFFSFPSLMDTARQMIGSEGGDFPAREAAFCVATEIRKKNYKQKMEKQCYKLKTMLLTNDFRFVERRKSTSKQIPLLESIWFSAVERVCHQGVFVVELREKSCNKTCCCDVLDAFDDFLPDWKILKI